MSESAGWVSCTRPAHAATTRPPRRFAHTSTGGRLGRATGLSVVELVLVVALMLGLAASGLEVLRSVARQQAGQAAARMLLHDLQDVAVRARSTGRARAVRLTAAGTGATWQEFEDGNGNGVRLVEIDAAVDPATGPPRPAFREGRAALAIVKVVPTTDHTGVLAAGASPIRFGVSPLIVFTPRRTSSSGSIYVAGDDARQYAIRILGTTQRWRLLCMDDAAFQWRGC
jgi:hypothetical protein